MGVALVLATLVFSAETALAQSLESAAAATGGSISASDAYQAASSGRTLLIDTREAYEKRSGSPAGVGAEITYLMGGDSDAGFIRDMLKLVAGKRDASITLICQAGVRSAAAQRVLERDGFNNVRSVAGGYSAWRERHLPSQTSQ